MARAFDAVLVIAFGGPQGRDDVRPFLANVLRGRRVPPERVEEVAHHYELFDGISPLTELTTRQSLLLLEGLRDRGHELPVYVGMRNWHPFLEDTLATMARHGVRRAVGVIAAAHRSYSSCTQYRENVEEARANLRRSQSEDVEIVYVGDWHLHPGFIDANADHVRDALTRLPEAVRGRARLIFTAHSIPVSMASKFPYQRQLEETARAVADRAGMKDWALVFQSRSGRPEDPWLGPDICDYLRQEAGAGLAADRALPHRLHLRSHRGALRPRHRGRRRVRRSWTADVAGERRQRSSPVHRRDGRGGPRDDRAIRRRAAAADRQRGAGTCLKF